MIERFSNAATQLADNIELCFNRSPDNRAPFSVKNWNNEIIRSITHDEIENFSSIYPLVIVQEHALRIGFANRWLRNLFQEKISNRALALERIRPLTLITIEDLEEVLPYLKDLSLVWILDEYIKYAEPVISFKQVFNNLIQRRPIPVRVDKWLDQKEGSFHMEIRPLFREIREATCRVDPKPDISGNERVNSEGYNSS